MGSSLVCWVGSWRGCKAAEEGRVEEAEKNEEENKEALLYHLDVLIVAWRWIKCVGAKRCLRKRVSRRVKT